MIIKFTKLYPLESVAQVNVTGEFNVGWRREYVKIWKGSSSYRQPDGAGSGLSVSNLPLCRELPNDLACLAESKGFVYVLVSCLYPILYVGITSGTLGQGIFGAGRFPHHLRKLLASRGNSTNHTEGWHEHARDRYTRAEEQVRKKNILDPSDIPALAPLLWRDLRIAIAHHGNPQNHEGFVLKKFEGLVKARRNACLVMNTGNVKSEEIGVCIPGNWEEMCKEEKTCAPAVTSTLPEQLPEEFENNETNPEDVEDYKEFLKEMTSDCQEIFMKLLAWARHSARSGGVEEKKVNGYSNQPKGCDKIPMVLFAPLGTKGRARANQWVCRIPLVCGDCGMTIVLPTRTKAPVQDDKVIFGKDTNFRPKDIKDFLKNPQNYTTDPALNAARG
jgi:hypothetical protein